MFTSGKKGFMLVNALSLDKALGCAASFIFIYVAVCEKIIFKYPLAFHGLAAFG